MAKNNRENLAKDFSDLLNDIKGSFDVRIKSLGETVVDTHQMLDGFKKNREEMGEDLRNFLNKFKLNLQGQNFERFEDFQKFFHKLSKENQEAANELKKFLKKYNLDRIEDFFNFLKPIQNTFSAMHNSFKGFQEQMNNRRSKPFGFHTGSISSMRRTHPHSEEQKVKTGKSFKVNKGKKKKAA